MKRILFGAALLLALAAPARAIPPMVEADAPKAAPPGSLALPEKLECKRDQGVAVKCGGTAKRITWDIPTGVNWFPKPADYKPPEKPGSVLVEIDAGATVVFVAPPGQYTIRAYAAVAESVAVASTVLLVVDDKPAPPPIPPAPPAPPDPLAADLQKLYALDVPADLTARARALAALHAVYGQAAELAKGQSVETLEQLVAAISATVASSVPPDALPAVRDRLRAELKAALPPITPDPLTAATRAQIVATYGRLAKALEAVK